MKRYLAVVAIVVLLPVTAAAQNADAERITAVEACLLEAAGPAEDALFRNLFAALIEQDADTARAFLTPIVALTRDVAITQCGQPENFLELEWVGTLLGNYIQSMLVSIFSNALQRLQAL